MSSDESPFTPHDLESDIDYSVYSLSSDLDLDFGLRGNNKPYPNGEVKTRTRTRSGRDPETLLVHAAKVVAVHFPFEVVETSPLNVPEELQRLIAFYSFPTDEDDICLYSCLSSGGSYEFDQGEALWADKAVKDCVQIGFHLTATVLTSLHIAPASGAQSERPTIDPSDTNPTSVVNDSFHVNFTESRRPSVHPEHNQPSPSTDDGTNRPAVNIEATYPAHRVSLTFDRGRITSCSCTCTFDSEDGCTNLTAPQSTYPPKEAARTLQNQPSAPQAFSYQLIDVFDPLQGQADGQHNFSSFLSSSGNQSDRQPGSFVPSFQTDSTGRLLSTNQPLDIAGGISALPGTWCSHVVATCLFRIRQPDKVLLRSPISESLAKLDKEDLLKFAQNLICHMGPKKILPAAQKILDQLLDSADNPLKKSIGAPDPTAGGAIGDAAAWCFDGGVLESKLRVTLRRFWSSNPSVIYSDIGSLNAESPIDVENFQCVLHSLRGNDPRGVWDLLSIIGDMMRRQDNNGVLLLEIVTRCVIDMPELMLWWYLIQTKYSLSFKSLTVCQKQLRCAALWLCEEIVQLWRLVCLNPELRASALNPGRFPSGSSSQSNPGREMQAGQDPSWLLQQLCRRLGAFHVYALQQVCSNGASNADGSAAPSSSVSRGQSGTRSRNIPKDHRKFLGFKPALAACHMRWSPELPPTHGLSVDEFRACLPSFTGSRIDSASLSEGELSASPVIANLIAWMRTHKPLETKSHFNAELYEATITNPYADLLAELPCATDELEVAFIRFHALDTHGHFDQALPWARYLACHLLHLSPAFVSCLEAVSFNVVYRSVSEQSDTEGSKNASTSETNGGRTKKPVGKSARSSSRGHDGSPQIDSALADRAIQWATKTSRLLDRIRCLMECLTRSYQDSISVPVNVTSVNRITNSGRSLLTFRGPDPTLVSLHLDDTSSPIAQPVVRNSMVPIKDEWTRLDIELAFRLGLYGLSLPRPPTPSPTVEVRVFDQEVALVNRMCCLPLHVACPHVLQSIRTEATLLARSPSIYQTDLLVPYTLATYLFHQLVGTRPLSTVLDHLSNPSTLVATTSTSNAGTSNLNGTTTYRCPVLTTGAILGGSGLPLALSNHVAATSGRPNVSALQYTLTSDADLGFAVALNVLSTMCRVPQSVFPYFAESQWAQRDALVVYLCRHYRDDVAKLDRILVHLLDRHYNPNFKAPPLWACLSLPSHDLMQYNAPEPQLDQNPAEKTEAENATPVKHCPTAEDPAATVSSTSTSMTETEQVAQDTQETTPHTGGAVANPQQSSSSIFDTTFGQQQTSVSEDNDTLSDSKIRTTILTRTANRDPRHHVSHSIGMAAVDTSAPETTSSDNSPTATRRLSTLDRDQSMTPITSLNLTKVPPVVTTSGKDLLPEMPLPSRLSRKRTMGVRISSSEDDDPIPSRLDQQPDNVEVRRNAGAEVIEEVAEQQTDPSSNSGDIVHLFASSSTGPEGTDSGSPMLSILPFERLPVQPLSDSMAYHAFHLAKYVRKLAGGPSANESVFVAEPDQTGVAMHHNLQLVAFQIGLYGLGLYNGLLPSWSGRTYSRNGSWISQQVFELGIPAACILYHSWQQHLTPTELTGIAFQLSRDGNPVLVDIAVELCLAGLTHCTTLRPEDVFRALRQCEAHSSGALERGLLKIEASDDQTTYGILPEILFHVARNWFSLHQVTIEELKSAMERLRGVQSDSGTVPDESTGSNLNVTNSSTISNVPSCDAAGAVSPNMSSTSYSALSSSSPYVVPVDSSTIMTSQVTRCPYITRPVLYHATSTAPAQYPVPQPAMLQSNTPMLYSPQFQVSVPHHADPNLMFHAINQGLVPQSVLSQHSIPGLVQQPTLFQPFSPMNPVTVAYLSQFGLGPGMTTNVNSSYAMLVPIQQPSSTVVSSGPCVTPSQYSENVTQPAQVVSTAIHDGVQTQLPSASTPESPPASAPTPTEAESDSVGLKTSDEHSSTDSAEPVPVVDPMDTELNTLENRSMMYLKRAYHCATRAIKKICLPTSNANNSSISQPGLSSNSVEGGRGRVIKSLHAHQSRQKHGPQYKFSTDNNPPPNGIAWQGQGSIIDSRGVRVSIAMDPQTVKGWDANILWTFDVASTLGSHSVHDYCNLVLQCVQSPLLLNEITIKAINYFKSLDNRSTEHTNDPSHLEPLTGPTAQSVRLPDPSALHSSYPAAWPVPNNSLPPSYDPHHPYQLWHPSAPSMPPEQMAAILAQYQQLVVPTSQGFVDPRSGINTSPFAQPRPVTARMPPHPQTYSGPSRIQSKGRELLDQMINRTHSLFHKFIDQRLQFLGPGQTDWDDFVDLILKAYQVHLTMPATDSGLHWNSLLTRIRRHHKCSSNLWQRILAGIQTADLKRITA